MSIKNKNHNIIIKGKTPSWRPLQPRLGSFKSLHKDDSTKVDPSLSVDKMFAPDELIKIWNACEHTKTLGIDMNNEDETPEQVAELKRILIESGKKVK